MRGAGAPCSARSSLELFPLFAAEGASALGKGAGRTDGRTGSSADVKASAPTLTTALTWRLARGIYL
ncbi:hypothetical protein PR003_g7294 [Phytophthora rubi]|uniref:Uncharacterized protein n=1 Tax=Phytophthora rubi TaxID=129364 RepID=A0A6A3NAY0_9STRA|nr:hypothetical protein PR001_g6920 [Phytophthora rubi]KAE9346706.1 hypothetical protein PR003_g7294 [Phytophthora rubi]